MKLVSKDKTRDFALVFGSNLKDRLPKKAPATMTVNLGGSPVVAPVTVNKGWAVDDLVLTYPWFLIDGKPYYATLGPGETLDGEWTVEAGVATRKDPKRVPKNPVTEAERIAKFRETYAANRTPAAPTVTEPAPAEPVTEPTPAPTKSKKK